MKKDLFSAVVVLLAVSTIFAQSPIDRIEGIGKDREHMTPKQIENRTGNVEIASKFWLLRDPGAEKAWKRIHDKKLSQIILNAAKGDKNRAEILQAIIFVESQGKEDALSRSGPAGIAQLAESVVSDYNKRATKAQQIFIGMVKTGKFKTQAVYEYRGQGKKRKKLAVGKQKVPVLEKLDERYDPEKAIPAMAWQFARLYEIFGRDDIAIQAYHDGMGSMENSISFYTGLPRARMLNSVEISDPSRDEVSYKTVASIVQRFDLSWPKIFFENTPNFRPKLYNYLEIMRTTRDFAPLYSFRVQEARPLLALSEFEYGKEFDRYVNQFGKAPLSNPMFAFYSPDEWKEMQFQNLTELQKPTKEKQLVDVPTPWQKYGFTVRTMGDGPIAQMGPEHQADYIKAAPETIGCLLYVINELRLYEEQLAAKRDSKPLAFEPIELTSMVRTKEYQGWLRFGRWLGKIFMRGNPNAQTDQPLHTLGQAIDIAFARVHGERKANLLFDLKVEGMLEFLWEDKAQNTLHIVPYPTYKTFFQTICRQAVS